MSWNAGRLRHKNPPTNQPKISTYCGVVSAAKRLLFQFLCCSVFETWFSLTLGLAVSGPYYSKCKLKSQARHHLRRQLKYFLHQKGRGRWAPALLKSLLQPLLYFHMLFSSFPKSKGSYRKKPSWYSLGEKGEKKPHLPCWADTTSRDAGRDVLAWFHPSTTSTKDPPVLCNHHVWGLQSWVPPGTLQWHFFPLFFAHLHTEYSQALLPISFLFMLLDNRGNIIHRTGSSRVDDIARSQLPLSHLP